MESTKIYAGKVCTFEELGKVSYRFGIGQVLLLAAVSISSQSIAPLNSGAFSSTIDDVSPKKLLGWPAGIPA